MWVNPLTIHVIYKLWLRLFFFVWERNYPLNKINIQHGFALLEA
jgi:hypothetical protein